MLYRRRLFAVVAFSSHLVLASCSTSLNFGDTASDTAVINAVQNHIDTPANFPFAPIAANGKGALAINLEHLENTDKMLPFTNLMELASPWLPQHTYDYTWDTGEALSQDVLGNILQLAPGQAAGKHILNDMAGAYPAGTYTFVHEGEGTFQFLIGATLISKSTDGALTVYQLNVSNQTNGIHIKMTGMNPSKPVRNMKLLMPGFNYHDFPKFNPDYLKVLKTFNTLRFLEWTKGNYNQDVHWQDRTSKDASTQIQKNGVAYENAISLCNTLDANLWLNLPYLANDDYARQLARLLRDTFENNLLIYIEYGNEMWNGVFPGAVWAEAQGLSLNLSSNPLEAQLRFYAKRATEVMKIFEQEFSGQTHRLRRVIATQAANPWTSSTVLDFQDTAAHADVLAIGPYFGNSLGSPETQWQVANMSMTQIMAELAKDIEVRMAQVVQHKALATAKGLKLVAYEAGQHFSVYGTATDNQQLVNLAIAANKDPFMKTLYLYYVLRWHESGGELMSMYHLQATYGKFSTFGLFEQLYGTLPASPKVDAVSIINSSFGPWFTY